MKSPRHLLASLTLCIAACTARSPQELPTAEPLLAQTPRDSSALLRATPWSKVWEDVSAVEDHAERARLAGMLVGSLTLHQNLEAAQLLTSELDADPAISPDWRAQMSAYLLWDERREEWRFADVSPIIPESFEPTYASLKDIENKRVRSIHKQRLYALSEAFKRAGLWRELLGVASALEDHLARAEALLHVASIISSSQKERGQRYIVLDEALAQTHQEPHPDRLLTGWMRSATLSLELGFSTQGELALNELEGHAKERSLTSLYDPYLCQTFISYQLLERALPPCTRAVQESLRRSLLAAPLFEQVMRAQLYELAALMVQRAPAEQAGAWRARLQEIPYERWPQGFLKLFEPESLVSQRLHWRALRAQLQAEGRPPKAARHELARLQALHERDQKELSTDQLRALDTMLVRIERARTLALLKKRSPARALTALTEPFFEELDDDQHIAIIMAAVDALFEEGQPDQASALLIRLIELVPREGNPPTWRLTWADAMVHAALRASQREHIFPLLAARAPVEALEQAYSRTTLRTRQSPEALAQSATAIMARLVATERSPAQVAALAANASPLCQDAACLDLAMAAALSAPPTTTTPHYMDALARRYTDLGATREAWSRLSSVPDISARWRAATALFTHMNRSHQEVPGAWLLEHESWLKAAPAAVEGGGERRPVVLALAAKGECERALALQLQLESVSVDRIKTNLSWRPDDTHMLLWRCMQRASRETLLEVARSLDSPEDRAHFTLLVMDRRPQAR